MADQPASSVVSGILERLDKIQEEETKLSTESDMLWKRMYDLIDDTVGEGEPYRWTHPTLKKTIGRVMANNSPMLDQNVLKASLKSDQWKLCTKQQQVFDLERLTTAVADGKIDKGDVAAATTTKPPTARKHFKAASKDELKALEAAKLS
jgi:hypothetical protein